MSKSSGTVNVVGQEARGPDAIEPERAHLARHRVAREDVDVPSLRRRLDEVRAEVAARLVALGVDVADLDLAVRDEAVDHGALDLEPLASRRLRRSAAARVRRRYSLTTGTLSARDRWASAPTSAGSCSVRTCCRRRTATSSSVAW